MGHGGAQEIGPGDEVGVEDGHQLAAGGALAGLERPGLETGAFDAVQVMDVETLDALALDEIGDDRAGLVGRVVEHLDLEAIARVV